jgi:hypothetical protein
MIAGRSLSQLKVRLLTFLLVSIVVLHLSYYASLLTLNATAFEDVLVAIDKESLVFHIPYQSSGQQNIMLHGLADVNMRISKSDLRDDFTGATIDSSNIIIPQFVDIDNGQDTEISVNVTASERGNFEGIIWFLSNDGRASSVQITLDTGPHWEAILPLTIGGYITSLTIWNLIPRIPLREQFEGIKSRIAWIKHELDHFKSKVKILGPYYYLIDDNARHLLKHMENSEVEEAEALMKNIEKTFADMIDPKNLDIKDDDMIFSISTDPQKTKSIEKFVLGLQSVREQFQTEMRPTVSHTKADSELIKKINEQHKPDLTFDQIIEKIKNTSFCFWCYIGAEWERSLLVNFLTLTVGLIVALGLILQNNYLDSLRSLSGEWWRPALILFGIGAGIESAKQLLGNIRGK